MLAVRDLRVSSRFYIDVLGFVRDFGDGSDGWSFLSRDGLRVMLGECPDATTPGDHFWYAYVTTESVDRLHEEVAGRGADTLSPPTTKPWGLREFSLETPDGHRVVFGETIGATD